MNLIEGTVTRYPTGYVFDAGPFSFFLNKKMEGALRREGIGSAPMTFGIRPEDTHDPEYAPPSITKALLEAKVDVTELMGNEVLVHLMTEHTQIIGRFDPRTGARVGNTIPVIFNMDRMHVFSKQTQMAIR